MARDYGMKEVCSWCDSTKITQMGKYVKCQDCLQIWRKIKSTIVIKTTENTKIDSIHKG